MDPINDHIYAMLMAICPEVLKPFAEISLPGAIEQMEEDKKAELEARLVEIQDKPEQDQAQALILFAQSMGADPSMFNMPELAGYF